MANAKKEKTETVTVTISVSEHEELQCYKSLWVLAANIEQQQVQMMRVKQRLTQLQQEK